MPIENRNLQAGTVLKARHKGKEHTCEVVKTKDGLRYRLKDGKEFNSPSSAGREITGGVAVNGWRFWSVESTEKPKPEPKADKPKKAKKEPAAKKSGSKAAKKSAGKARKTGKVVRAAAASDAWFGCGVCGEEFPTMKAATKHAAEAHLSN